MSYSLYIYGSRARNDSVEHSDTDLLIVFENVKNIDKDSIMIPENLSAGGNNLDISYYSVDRLKEMYKAGHLFAWHLFTESKYLDVGIDYLKNMGKPEQYMSFTNDVQPLLELLESSKKELKSSSANVIYEAGLVYVCARNIAISASYYSPAGLTFSTYAPFLLENNNNPFPINKDVYEKLRRARLAGTRGLNPLGILRDEVLESIKNVTKWATAEYDRIANERVHEAFV